MSASRAWFARSAQRASADFNSRPRARRDARQRRLHAVAFCPQSRDAILQYGVVHPGSTVLHQLVERTQPFIAVSDSPGLYRGQQAAHSWRLSETERRAQRQGPHPCSPLIRMPCLANTHLHGPGKLRCKPTIMSRPSIAGALHFSGINCQSGQGVMLTMQRDPWRRVIIQMASAWRQFLFWLVSRPTRPRYQSRTMHPQFLAEDVLHERIRNERLADRLVRHKRLK